MAFIMRGPRGGVRGVVVIRPEAGAMLIENVAVHPRYQRHGLGSRLMQFAEDRARASGLGELLLITNPIMTRSVAFYERLGFAEVDRHTAEGFERVFMRKALA
jgi:ribosomal protein S18 acetylase RimI-like enzyme